MADGADLGGWAGPTVWVNGQLSPLINIRPSASQGAPGYNGGGINPTGPDADSIVRTVAAEAGNQSPEGQRAVAHVILNRVKNTGKSPSEIVSQPGQFEGYDNGNASKIDSNSSVYKSVADNVAPVIAGDHADPTNGATHFYSPKAQAALGRNPPAWANGEGQQIGDHVFYNNVDGEHAPSIQGRPTGDVDWNSGQVVNNTPSVGTSVAPDRAQAGVDWEKGTPVNSGIPLDNAAPAQPPKSAGYQKAFAQANQNPNAIGQSVTGALANIAGPFGGLASQIPDAQNYSNSALNGYLVHALPVIQGGANAIGQALTNIVNRKSGISAGEAYQAGRDASQQALSSYGKEHPVLNTAADLGGQIAASATIPEAKGLGLGLRLLQGAAKVGGQSALTGAGGAASEGQGAGDIAKSAAVQGAIGTALSPLGEAGHVASLPFKTAGGKAVVRLLAPSVIGGGLATAGTYNATGNPKEAALAGLMASGASGMPGLLKSKAAQKILTKVIPTDDKLAALMHLTKAVGAETPEGAAAVLASKPGKSVVEALNEDHRESLMQTAGELNPNNLEHAQQVIETRQHPTAVKGRLKGAVGGGDQDHNSVDNLKNGIETSGLPHPDTAQMDYVEHLENQHNTVARPEWAKIAEDEPLHTEQHQKLLGEPEVREAMSRARHNLGPAAETANPDYVPPDNLKSPENLTAEDYKEVNKDRVGFDEKGNSVFNPDVPEVKQGNSKAIADYLNKKNGVDVNSGEPETVPTAKAWIEAQKHLESEVARNDFTGKVEPDSKSSVGNWRRSQLSRELNELNKSTIGNLTEAKAASGDVISGRENAIKGANLGNKAGQSWQEHRANFEKLDEGDKAAQRFGYSKQMSRDFSRVNPETGDGLDTFINKYSNEDHTEIQKTLLGEDKANKLQQSLYNTKLARAIDKLPIESGNIEPGHLSHLEKLLNSESEQKLQNKIYGKDKAEQIREAIRQEINLAKQGKDIADFNAKQHKEGESLKVVPSGAFGYLTSGVKGALTGAFGAMQYQLAEHAHTLVKQGDMTPAARQYLGETLAKPTEQVAEELKQAAAQKRNMKASQSQLASKVGHAAALVGANTIGPPITHALSNVNTN